MRRKRDREEGVDGYFGHRGQGIIRRERRDCMIGPSGGWQMTKWMRHGPNSRPRSAPPSIIPGYMNQTKIWTLRRAIGSGNLWIWIWRGFLIPCCGDRAIIGRS